MKYYTLRDVEMAELADLMPSFSVLNFPQKLRAGKDGFLDAVMMLSMEELKNFNNLTSRDEVYVYTGEGNGGYLILVE